MELTKIVITGGPCGGKSTAMSWIQNAFATMGYTVLFVPETATELISGGVAPWTCGTNGEYQKCQMKLQLEKEKVFEQGARSMKVDKILMVCDRGALDNKVYMNEEEYQAVLDFLNTNEIELRDNYDAVFHLVTAAKGATEFYTLSNNAARIESVEQAIAMDDKFIHCWTGHPHLRVIDNSTNFENKMKRLIAEISSFLGETLGAYDSKRRFLIEYPDLEALERNPNCQRIEIIQTYLKSNADEEVRVRQRGYGGHYIYYKTVRRLVGGQKRVEVEKRLTQSQYLTLLMEADTTRRQIRKNRYCLMHEGQYFEIDVYPFWDHQAILEIEQSEEGQEIHFPPELKILREVTEDARYETSALAVI